MEKLDRTILVKTTENARHYLVIRRIDRHSMHEEFIAQCWLDGFTDALASEGLTLLIEKKEKNDKDSMG